MAASFAQGSDIRGTVVDSVTGERVPFASVMVLGTQRGAATNLNGFFLIANVPPGNYQVAAGAVGYLRRVRDVTVRGGEPINLEFRIPPEAVQMDEVVVREQAHRELKEISTSIHVMDSRDLKIVPVTVQSDVFRSIQILPGVVSSSDVSAQFYVRGGASDQNLILLDGIRVYSPFHAFGVFSIFDADIIKATEVCTGAFPPGFGGRLSSVVNGRKSLSSAAFTRLLRTKTPVSFYDLFAKLTTDGAGPHTRFHFMTFQTEDALPSGAPMQPEYRWRNSLYGVRATTLFGDRVYVNTLLSYSSAAASRTPVSEIAPVSSASTSVKEFALRADGTIYTDGGSLYFVGFDFSFPTVEYNLINPTGLTRDVRWGTMPRSSISSSRDCTSAPLCSNNGGSRRRLAATLRMSSPSAMRTTSSPSLRRGMSFRKSCPARRPTMSFCRCREM